MFEQNRTLLTRKHQRSAVVQLAFHLNNPYSCQVLMCWFQIPSVYSLVCWYYLPHKKNQRNDTNRCCLNIFSMRSWCFRILSTKIEILEICGCKYLMWWNVTTKMESHNWCSKKKVCMYVRVHVCAAHIWKL